jgi:hypothetical protein
VKLDKNEVESMLAMSVVIDWNETNEKNSSRNVSTLLGGELGKTCLMRM